MQSEEIRKRFLNFFQERNHTIIPSASLVPDNDPTVLFITAGMQPLIPYLQGREHPAGKRLVNIQKCVRTQDIDEVGDATHDTFFEMMGNWSLGDYFKKEAIEWSYELLTDKEKGFGFDSNRLYVTVYAGDEKIPRDSEATQIWRSVGIPENRIYYLGANANWWPNVKDKDDWTGPTGPSTEMFYDITNDGLGDLTHEEFLQADEEQKIVEIWNDVFMTYEKVNGKIVGELAHKNVDTGAGLERLAMALQKKDNIFETDLFKEIMKVATTLTTEIRHQRIIADHFRTAVFMIADGVTPSNTDRGYVLRRLLRRALIKTSAKSISKDQIASLVEAVAEKYQNVYGISSLEQKIKLVIEEELEKFNKTLANGLRKFNKQQALSPSLVFELVTTDGFPFELVKELAGERGLIVDELAFEADMKKHRELSRLGAEQKFKGGLADTSEMSVKYHTATHLLQQALKEVLGDTAIQKGSNITPERLRFDFAHHQKLTEEEKKRVENIVNQKIEANLLVQGQIMSKTEAEKTGAHHFFAEKYGDMVSVYYIGDSLATAWSKEFCGGPHVENTGQLGHFKIIKEEAVSAGIRRIKAVFD